MSYYILEHGFFFFFPLPFVRQLQSPVLSQTSPLVTVPSPILVVFAQFSSVNCLLFGLDDQPFLSVSAVLYLLWFPVPLRILAGVLWLLEAVTVYW